MRFGDASFTALDSFPTVVFPSLHLTYSNNVGAHIGAMDSVSIKEFANTPSFIGRITTVEPSLQAVLQRDESVHPFVSTSASCSINAAQDSYLRINWFLLKEQDSNNSCQWPAIENHNRTACQGVTEAAATNCVIWVSVRQVSHLVFIPHLNECTDHTFGPMHGRANTYFTTFRVMLHEDNHLLFHPISREEHSFLPSSSVSLVTTKPSTYTERIIEGTYVLTKENYRNLTGDKRLKKTSSLRLPTSRECFVSHQAIVFISY